MTGSADELTKCPNCGTALNGRYCPEWGQKAAPIHLPFLQGRKARHVSPIRLYLIIVIVTMLTTMLIARSA